MGMFIGIGRNTARSGAVLLLLLVFVLFTYNIWWLALLVSLLIILLSYAAWPGRNIDLLGLRIPLPQAMVSLLISLMTIVVAWLIISAVVTAPDIQLIPIWRRDTWMPLILHSLGQTLNEEMVLGSLLLKSVANKFQRLSLAAVSILVALAFSTLHYAFYAFRPTYLINYGVLSLTTLASIFAVGLLRNICILSTGNIAYAWGIHFGWNLIFIDSLYIHAATQAELTEPEMFNAVFGNSMVLLMVGAAAGLSFLLYRFYFPPYS
jgi:membrane protease YdiL (CAAX protease family)